MAERWRNIKDFPGYRVSSTGKVKGPRVKNLKHQHCPGSPYPKVTLSKNGIHTDKRVNVLVAQAFIPNPDNLPLVMHMDNNPSNNNVENLKWGTYSENNQYMWDCGRHEVTLTDEDREKAYQIRRRPVVSINCANGERLEFISQHEAARQLGVSQQHIWGVLNGHRRSTGGYFFEYLDKEEYANGNY